KNRKEVAHSDLMQRWRVAGCVRRYPCPCQARGNVVSWVSHSIHNGGSHDSAQEHSLKRSVDRCAVCKPVDGEYDSRASLTSIRAQDANTDDFPNTHSNRPAGDLLR